MQTWIDDDDENNNNENGDIVIEKIKSTSTELR